MLEACLAYNRCVSFLHLQQTPAIQHYVHWPPAGARSHALSSNVILTCRQHRKRQSTHLCKLNEVLGLIGLLPEAAALGGLLRVGVGRVLLYHMVQRALQCRLEQMVLHHLCTQSCFFRGWKQLHEQDFCSRVFLADARGGEPVNLKYWMQYQLLWLKGAVLRVFSNTCWPHLEW